MPPRRKFARLDDYQSPGVLLSENQDADWLLGVILGDTANISDIATAIGTAVNAVTPIMPAAFEFSLLASQARASAAAQASPDQTNYKGVRGAMLFLNVTGAAGALKTLTLDVQVKDPVSGVYVTIASSGVIGTTVTAAGAYVLMVYPGAGSLLAGLFAGNAALPKTWRARVIANDATSWTYSLGASLLQ